MRHNAGLIKISIIILHFFPSILFGQQTDFPYKLKKSDLIIVGVGLSSRLIANYKEDHHPLMTYDELTNLDRSDINRFDRGATYNWNKDSDEYSDWTRAALVASPAILVLNTAVQKEWKNCLTYAAMYMEVAVVTLGLTGLTKSIAMRKRPYLYNTNISLTEREELMKDDDVFDSFFSGHTSIAFASAVFLSKTHADIYGQNHLNKILWGTSLAVASTTGFLRYKSGYHYPTDVIAGALVGSAIGYIIPVLHKKNTKTKNLSYRITGDAINLTYKF